MKKVLIGVVVFFVIVAIAKSGGSNPAPSSAGSGAPRPAAAPPPSTPAQLLADHQAGKRLQPDNPLVQTIAGHVASLDRKCRGSANDVAAAIEFGSTDLAKHSISQSRSQLAAHLDRSIKGFDPNFDCQGFVAGYLVLREKGH